jgi:hypothetical protein
VGCQELLVSLLLELYPEQVTPLAEQMGADEGWPAGCADAPCAAARADRAAVCVGLGLRLHDVEAEHFFWYRSAEKEEPPGHARRGTGREKEMQLGIARNIQRCHAAVLEHLAPIRRALTAHCSSLQPGSRHGAPPARHGADRLRRNPPNLAEDMLPIHLLRCKLAFFGAGKFDPKSSRWVRITLFQGAPLGDMLNDIGQPFTTTGTSRSCRRRVCDHAYRSTKSR